MDHFIMLYAVLFISCTDHCNASHKIGHNTMVCTSSAGLSARNIVPKRSPALKEVMLNPVGILPFHLRARHNHHCSKIGVVAEEHGKAPTIRDALDIPE